MKGFLLVHINLVSLMVGKCGSGDDTIRSRGKAFSTVGLGNVGKHPIIFFFFLLCFNCLEIPRFTAFACLEWKLLN